MPGANTPPTEPIKNFEANVKRVAELIGVHELLGSGPGKPAQRRSDVAAAAIVMTLSAADTYFGDRLAADFQRCFNMLTQDQLSGILASAVQADGHSNGLAARFAEALQSAHPKEVVIAHFKSTVHGRTYQEPDIVQRDLELFGIRGLWGDVGYCWGKKFGGHRRAADKIFREWSWRRNDIAHRSGRARSPAKSVETKARPGQSATRVEATACLIDFSRLIALVDFHLNAKLYKRQPRTRQSELAIFNLAQEPPRRSRKQAPLTRVPRTRRPAAQNKAPESTCSGPGRMRVAGAPTE